MAREDEPATHAEIGSLLHGILFGYEQLVLKMYGGNHKAILPHIEEEINHVISTDEFTLFKDGVSFEVNLDRLVRFLSNEDILKDVNLKRLDEAHFELDIGECSYAKSGIHDILDMRKGTCPFAVVIATVMTSLLEGGEYFEIEHSEFTEKGSKTVLGRR